MKKRPEDDAKIYFDDNLTITNLTDDEREQRAKEIAGDIFSIENGDTSGEVSIHTIASSSKLRQ